MNSLLPVIMIPYCYATLSVLQCYCSNSMQKVRGQFELRSMSVSAETCALLKQAERPAKMECVTERRKSNGILVI